MHPPFESEIVYIMTGAYVPWLLEGWPFLLMAALFFAAKLSGGRQLKRIQEEQRRHSHETGRQAMNEQRQRRRRHHTSISSNARETVIMKSPPGPARSKGHQDPQILPRRTTWGHSHRCPPVRRIVRHAPGRHGLDLPEVSDNLLRRVPRSFHRAADWGAALT